MSRGPRGANPRRQLRMILFAAGLLPALVVLAFGAKIGLMLQDNAAGRDAFDRGDHDGAAAEFAGNRTLNWFESWLAPFNEGASHHADLAWDRAVTSYEQALETVPGREECTVRINLALVHEAVGDAAQEQGATAEATRTWQEGIDVLAAGDCPTDAGRGEEQTEDAETLDQRLRDKQQQNQSEEPPEDPPPPPEDPNDGDDPDDGEDPRQERLERNNQQGQGNRGQEQRDFEPRNYTAPNSW